MSLTMDPRGSYVVERTMRGVHKGLPWPSGPWDSEPDKEQWQTKAGLPALIVRSWSGALCGYVGVPRGHVCYGVGYEEVETHCAIHVHGGLTYANHCQVDGPICHIPAPGEPDDVWWLGFDCCNAWDIAPGMISDRFPPGELDRYRDMAYVRAEVESLAAQLAGL